MKNADGKDGLTYMVFAEQRLLAMTAKKMKLKLRTLT